MQSFLFQLGIDAIRLLVWLVLLAAIFVPLERFFAIADDKRQPSSVAGELGYYFLNSLLPALVLAIPLAFTAAAARSLLPPAWLALVAAMPFVVKLLVSLFLSELCGYWGHRLAHQWPLLWQFHGRHHEPVYVNWLSNTHDHPVDIVWTRLTSLLPVYALALTNPVPSQEGIIPVVLTVFSGFWAFFIHADLRWRLAPLEHLLVTPAFHHWHHSNDEWRDHNYATLLPVMDRIFGTHHLPGGRPSTYGIDRPDQLAPIFPFASPAKGQPDERQG